MNLNDNERKVLACLVAATAEWGFAYLCFAELGERLKLECRVVRLACRSLKRKGLAEFGKGLWGDFGPAGAGYCATRAGADWLRKSAGLQVASAQAEFPGL